MPDLPQQPMVPFSSGGDANVFTSLNAIAQQLGALQEINTAILAVLTSAFPQQAQISATTGAATGKYLQIVGPDGITYKIPLNAV